MHYPYPPLLEEIQREVSRRLGVGFDHAMLNRYPNGNVHIGKHRDVKENQVSCGLTGSSYILKPPGMEQVVASLSLGARRTFIMHPHISKGEQKRADAEAKRSVLGNGSLLVMQGDTQENWKVRSVSIPLMIYCHLLCPNSMRYPKSSGSRRAEYL